jgi:hypothetical protein
MKPLFNRVVGKLSNEIAFDFNSMLRVYQETFPESTIEFKRSYSISFITHCKAWIGVFYLVFYKPKKLRKYFFQGSRNSQVLDIFSPSDITIIGGKYEKRNSSDKGFGFFWTGGIVAAILLTSKKNKSIALQIQIALFLKKFKNKTYYFFLIEDTLPVGSFFAKLGNEINKPTILIQHGYITGSEILIDGKNCTYNILYSIDQAKFIQNHNAKSFELGPPFDIKNNDNIINEVILVGTGGKGYISELYYKALDVYLMIEKKLLISGISVLYRPHPNEDYSDYYSKFNKIDMSSVSECISGPRKVFIGYVSTLLFEAKTFGHGVVAITDPEEPSLAYTPDYEIEANNIGNIEEVILLLQQKLKNKKITKLDPLKKRFIEILDQIKNHSDKINL